MFGPDDAIAGGVKLLDDAINKIWPNPEDKAKAEAVAMTAAADAAVSTIKAQTSVMLAEAQSADKWTSRARPSFLYVMYALLLAALPFAILWAFEPATADRMALGFQKWLAAIPDGLWSTFTTGYLGYVVARETGKAGGIMPLVMGKK
jgi:hypothetical protein